MVYIVYYALALAYFAYFLKPQVLALASPAFSCGGRVYGAAFSTDLLIERPLVHYLELLGISYRHRVTPPTTCLSSTRPGYRYRCYCLFLDSVVVYIDNPFTGCGRAMR